MTALPCSLQFLVALIAGWLNRHQQQVLEYLLEENRRELLTPLE